MTVGEDSNHHIQILELHCENSNYCEVRPVQNFGHEWLEGEAEQRQLRQLEQERELVMLKARIKQDQENETEVAEVAELIESYRKLFEELKENLQKIADVDRTYKCYLMEEILAKHEDFIDDNSSDSD